MNDMPPTPRPWAIFAVTWRIKGAIASLGEPIERKVSALAPEIDAVALARRPPKYLPSHSIDWRRRIGICAKFVGRLFWPTFLLTMAYFALALSVPAVEAFANELRLYNLVPGVFCVVVAFCRDVLAENLLADDV